MLRRPTLRGTLYPKKLTRSERFLAWANDPVLFATDVFKQAPREVQPEIMRAVAESRWTSVAACRDLGKSRIAAYLATWFLVTRPNSLVFTVAPTWAQTIEALWAEIRGIWYSSALPELLPGWEVLTTKINTNDPLWRAIGVSSKDVQNLEGRHGAETLVIIDESKGVSDEFFNSIQGMITQRSSKLLAIGTPGAPRGWFARSFSVERSLWDKSFQISASQIPRLLEHYEREKRRLGESNPWFRQQQEAKFAGADEFSLLPIDNIEDAVKRYDLPWEDNGTRMMSLDPAGKGSDDSVLTFRIGDRITHQEAWNGWDEMRTAMHAAKKAADFRPKKIVVDEIGIGAGIRSRVREILAPTGIEVVGFNAGRSPKRTDRYMNRKTEEAFKLRERFLTNRIIIPNDPTLIEQLCSWTTDFTASGKTKLVDPEDSPDRADSLLLSFAADSVGNSFRQMSPSWL